MQHDLLKQFLLRANKPHADGTAELLHGADISRSIIFEDGDWKFHDNFFGGEPYGGREVIFYKNEPIWMRLYYGAVADKTDAHTVYEVLRHALQHPDKAKPYRGPDKYVIGEYVYTNTVTGEIDKFSGRESITQNGKEVYWATYFGGLVDQREKGVY